MPKRDESHMAGVRKQILDAAHAVFDRKGVGDTSIGDIAREAGFAVGSVYVHFKSKEDVLKQLIGQVDPNVAPFEACRTAGDLLGLVEALLKDQDQRSAAGQGARTALEVAIFTRRNPEVQAVVTRNFEALRDAVLAAAQRIAALAGQVDEEGARLVGEGLLSLLVSAQSQMLVGVSTHIEAKMKTARWLSAMLTHPLLHNE